ncbi:MAG: NifB/NifX family molybdenum-iron cluster-binding protein [Methanomassiliicoccales archaeon]|nr:MAG: NifB/NifX family molybdenum-iron cluster-binding protein [Methanomassiliicoccales archaeon]
MDDDVHEHFGRAPTFTLYDTESGAVWTIENTGEHMGGSARPPQLLQAEGVSIVLCGGLGPKAIRSLRERGIEVYVGCSGKVSDALESWWRGLLDKAGPENACREHHHH